MKKHFLSASVLLVCLFTVPQLAAASQKVFSTTDYPDSVSKIYRHTMLNDKVGVEAIQVKRLDEKHSSPRYCRAWVSLTKDGKQTQINYFDDINGLGGPSGLYAPNQAMPSNYHCLVKLGDYDGRMLLINEEGNHWNIPGGSFFLSKDKKYLFSVHECDAPAGVSVFDLKKGSTIFTTNEKAKEAPAVLDKWFFNGTNYFFTTKSADAAAVKSEEREIFVFDDKARKLEQKKISAAQLRSATEINYDFNALSDTDLKAAEFSLDAPATGNVQINKR